MNSPSSRFDPYRITRRQIPPVDFAFPSPVYSVLLHLQNSGYKAYLVGGCVRDVLMGRKPKDFDVATSATPEQVIEAFGNVIPTGLKHGTVTVVQDDEHIEVTTFRSEGVYSDGRRPDSVTFETDIARDLARRDFTMNAIAYDLVHAELVDPYGGAEDIEARVIKAVGDPDQRFGEDGLRPLRAVRFATTLNFTIESNTLEAIPDALVTFGKVSVERVTTELQKILTADRPVEGRFLIENGIHLLKSTGLLGAILPRILVNSDCLESAVADTPADFCIRLAALFSRHAGIAREELLRLKLPTEIINRTVNILKGMTAAAVLQSGSEAAFRKLCSEIGAKATRDGFDLAVSVQKANSTRLACAILERPALTTKELALNGADIMQALDCEPGMKVGAAQRALLDYVLWDPRANNEDTLRQRLIYHKQGGKLLGPDAFGNYDSETWKRL
jgi:tRNA nucleotidyltransferase (CCA-adding enzyme)